MPAGNISGRIVDNLGKPAVGVQIQLMKAVYNQIGVKTFQAVDQLIGVRHLVPRIDLQDALERRFLPVRLMR
jgi:hypothetical protein